MVEKDKEEPLDDSIQIGSSAILKELKAEDNISKKDTENS